jgi:hypothetical protein
MSARPAVIISDKLEARISNLRLSPEAAEGETIDLVAVKKILGI